MEYKIARGESIKEVTEEVNKMIGEGWKLQGGIAVTAYVTFDPGYDLSYWYVQAMVKEMPPRPSIKMVWESERGEMDDA